MFLEPAAPLDALEFLLVITDYSGRHQPARSRPASRATRPRAGRCRTPISRAPPTPRVPAPRRGTEGQPRRRSPGAPAHQRSDGRPHAPHATAPVVRDASSPPRYPRTDWPLSWSDGAADAPAALIHLHRSSRAMRFPRFVGGCSRRPDRVRADVRRTGLRHVRPAPVGRHDRRDRRRVAQGRDRRRCDRVDHAELPRRRGHDRRGGAQVHAERHQDLQPERHLGRGQGRRAGREHLHLPRPRLRLPEPVPARPQPERAGRHGPQHHRRRQRSDKTYYGETSIANEIRFAKNAIVLLNHLCYSAGSSETGDPEPTIPVARERVDNFASGFIKAGARAVIAQSWTSGVLTRSTPSSRATRPSSTCGATRPTAAATSCRSCPCATRSSRAASTRTP